MIAASWRSRERTAPGVVARGPRPVIVAFQGERGAYGDLAIEQRWGAGAWRLRCWDFEGVAAAVARGAADYGVFPVHNSVIGAIQGTRQAISRASLLVQDDVTIAVRHCVLGTRDATLESLRDLFSHPVALAQCAQWIGDHPSLRGCAAYDTAGAAREVAARRRPWEGAVASEECAARYGLHVLARDVGDRQDNATTFVIAARHSTEGE